METEAMEFLKEMENERDLFVKRVNEQDWNREMRTAAEDILIAYDQMRRRIELWGGNFDLDNMSKCNKHIVNGSVCSECGGKLLHKKEYYVYPYGDNIEYNQCEKCGRKLRIKCF